MNFKKINYVQLNKCFKVETLKTGLLYLENILTV